MGCVSGKSAADAPKDGKGGVHGGPPALQKSSSDKDPLAGKGGANKMILVMGKFQMSTAKEDLMGEGTSSICRKGVNVQTQEAVAIKVYKSGKETPKAEEVKLKKFRRQIQVLQQLQEPFRKVEDERLWCNALATAKPSRLFMSLVDFSKDAHDEAGPDPADGILYVITELAQYSLKDYLALRRDQNRPLPKDSVKNISWAIILVVAGLHAKGMVHLDLKPENLMMFNGRLKLIDVDGCVAAGTTISIQDSSISFSPCYCAPEWATFLIEDQESRIVVQPHLDVWSIGMTLCELVTLDAILKPQYANFLRNGHSHREAGFFFMDWLAHIKNVPLPKIICNFDPAFLDLLNNHLLVCDHKSRKTLAETLDGPHAYLQGRSKKPSSGGTADQEEELAKTEEHKEAEAARVAVKRAADTSDTKPIHKGTLWKLNSDGDPMDKSHWLKRDMWITGNGALCYWSPKHSKRLVLFDGAKLAGARITQLTGCAKEYAFTIETAKEDGAADDPYDKTSFGCEGEAEYGHWVKLLRTTANMDTMPKFQMGENFAVDLKAFKLSVKNRRMKVEDNAQGLTPKFTKVLWKVKADGNRSKQEDWFKRDMWLTQNGSLVYFSKKDNQNLVYYTADDLANAKFEELTPANWQDKKPHQPFAFQVFLKPTSDVEFAPGEFAAETAEDLKAWLREFRKLANE